MPDRNSELTYLLQVREKRKGDGSLHGGWGLLVLPQPTSAFMYGGQSRVWDAWVPPVAASWVAGAALLSVNVMCDHSSFHGSDPGRVFQRQLIAVWLPHRSLDPSCSCLRNLNSCLVLQPCLQRQQLVDGAPASATPAADAQASLDAAKECLKFVAHRDFLAKEHIEQVRTWVGAEHKQVGTGRWSGAVIRATLLKGMGGTAWPDCRDDV